VIDKLKVKELVVSERMFLWNDGKEDADLRMENGVIVARNRIFASEVCGNALVGKCVLTTPDDLVTTRLENCTVFTEMASSPKEGGLLTIRSPKGGHLLSDAQGVKTGFAYTVAYAENDVPRFFVRQNDKNAIAIAQFAAPPQVQQQQPAANAAGNAPSVPPADTTSAPVAPPAANAETARAPGNPVQ